MKRVLAAAALLTIAAVGFFVLWLETPGGAAWLSRWVTARLAREVPGTQVTLGAIDIQWPLQLSAQNVRWGRVGHPAVVEIDRLDLALHLRAWLQGKGLIWSEKSLIRRLDLAEFDATIAQGKWQAQGILSGQASFQGNGDRLDRMEVELTAQSPGGNLSSQFLQDLLSMMPEGDVRRKLLSALAQKATFHFNVGRFKLLTEAEAYVFSLYLDGDHLLDIGIRVPKDSLGLLGTLLS